MSQEFLFVLWAGGGNVPPQLTLARRLVAPGHRVRMFAAAVLRESIEAAGIVFEPYREIPEHDESVPERSLVRDFEARSKTAAAAAARDNLVAAMARPVAADVLGTLERRPADVVAFDFVLFGALFAAEKATVPAAWAMPICPAQRSMHSAKNASRSPGFSPTTLWSWPRRMRGPRVCPGAARWMHAGRVRRWARGSRGPGSGSPPRRHG